MSKITEAKCSHGYCEIPGTDRVRAFKLKETEVTIYEYRNYLLEMEFKRTSRSPIMDPIDRFNLAGNTKARIDHKAEYPYKASIQYPVVGVDSRNMASYCRYVGGDLPTDRQMALASAGDVVDPSDKYGRLAVWKGEPNQDGTEGTFPVTSGGMNQYGVYNLKTGSFEVTQEGAGEGVNALNYDPLFNLGVGDIVSGGVQVFDKRYIATSVVGFHDWNVSMRRVIDASGSADYIAGFRCAKPMDE